MPPSLIGQMLPECDTAILRANITASRYFRCSQFVDRCLGLLLLIPALPLMGFLVVLTRMSSQGPAIYKQTRVGKKGKLFTLYKIRTMELDAESETGAVWAALDGDPRITPLGAVLRHLHLDELPQVWNVVRGDMSIIGPRPERPEFTEHLSQALPGYLNRLQVRPGITGLAQLNLPPDTDLESVRQKVAVDLEYIRTANPLLDLRILLATSVKVVGLSGKWAAGFLGLTTCSETFRRIGWRRKMAHVSRVAASFLF